VLLARTYQMPCKQIPAARAGIQLDLTENHVFGFFLFVGVPSGLLLWASAQHYWNHCAL
jgi:hypothetical protein